LDKKLLACTVNQSTIVPRSAKRFAACISLAQTSLNRKASGHQFAVNSSSPELFQKGIKVFRKGKIHWRAAINPAETNLNFPVPIQNCCKRSSDVLSMP
jgi:hypothetical protein